MSRNFKLIIEYDGSGYSGWQRQKDPNTIQGAIEQAIHRLTGNSITLIGSGRTDAGVHALGQAANFHADTRLTAEDIGRALNSLLPGDIVILSCTEMPESFHARFDAVSKLYRYRFLNRPLPPAIGRQYAWHVKKKLDIDAMRAALVYLQGTHDFKAFEGAGSPQVHSVRQVLKAELFQRDRCEIDFEIEANGFLRHMVRNIVGTLVDVGRAKISPSVFKTIRDTADRSKAGVTAPPHGLFLVRVNYDS